MILKCNWVQGVIREHIDPLICVVSFSDTNMDICGLGDLMFNFRMYELKLSQKNNCTNCL